MKRTRTSKTWMSEHVSDSYVKQAQIDGYRSRAAYKLIEIDEKYSLFKQRMTVIDLGSAPGSWSQVAIKKNRLKRKCHCTGLIRNAAY